MINIIIGADLVPTKSNFKEFIDGDINSIVDDNIMKLLNTSHYKLFNLEVPLVDRETKLVKCGPNLIAPTKTINGIKKINDCFFTLANNHILDHKEQGLLSTMQILDKANIKYAGVGKNLNEAKKPHVFYVNNIRFGVYCCAENEFSIATNDSYGANPFDPLNSLEHIQNLKDNVDYVIVLYHGGKEHYRYPSPYLQKVCRRIVDYGADIVVCQHSHCIGCEEKWKNGTIVYGQGNFLFDDEDVDLNYWGSSLLIQLSFFDKKNYDIKYIPLVKNNNGVRIANNEECNHILEDFKKRSLDIKKHDFIENQYNQLAERYLNEYCGTFSPRTRSLFNRIMNKLTKKKWFSKRLDDDNKIGMLNYLQCEAHRELFLTGLKENLFNKKNY